jgi:2-methylisocitrate lyase-like PEP mutase family enzyme
MAHKAEHFRHLGERLAPPLMTLTSDGHLRKMGLTKAELATLGFRLLVDAVSPVLLFHKTMKQCYLAIANGDSDSLFAPQGLGHEQNELHQTIGLDAMLAIERETVEK